MTLKHQFRSGNILFIISAYVLSKQRFWIYLFLLVFNKVGAILKMMLMGINNGKLKLWSTCKLDRQIFSKMVLMFILLIYTAHLFICADATGPLSLKKLLSTKVTYITISDTNEIVISWQDHAQELVTNNIKKVRITYGIAGIPDTNKVVEVWRFELGVVLSTLNESEAYFVIVEYVKYMNDMKTIDQIFSTAPYYAIFDRYNSGCKKGVYDLIIKAQPNNATLLDPILSQVDVHSDIFKGAYNMEFDDKDKYGDFCLILASKQSSIQESHWLKFEFDDDYYVENMEVKLSRPVETVDKEIVNIALGSDKPSDYNFNGNAGTFVEDKIIVGFYQNAAPYELYFGLGFDQDPYTGLLLKKDGAPVVSKGMSALLLGRKSSTFHKDGQTFCSEICLPGIANITGHCPIPYTYFKQYFCEIEPTIKGGVPCTRRNCGKALKPAEITNIRGLTLTSLEVTWESLRKEYIEAGIHHYKLVLYKGTTLINVPEIQNNITALNLTNMQTNMEYHFTLHTFTNPGSHSISGETKNFTILSKVFASPDTIPSILQFVNKSHDSLYVTWDTSETYHSWFFLIKLYEMPGNVETAASPNEVQSLTLASGNSSYLFTDLKIFQLYRVTIRHVNNIGEGGYEKMYAMTDEYFPAQAPRRFIVSSVFPTKINLNWRPLTPEKTNGIILGYKIIVQMQNGNPVEYIQPHDATIYGVENVQENTFYNLSITAFNSHGESPVAHIWNYLTPSAVPDIAANLTSFNTSALSLNVSWVMEELMWNSEPGGFLLYYFEKNNPFEISTLNLTYENLTSVNGSFHCTPPFYMIEIKDLKPYEVYQIEMLAYNNEGFGKVTQKFTVSTEEQAPLVPPKNLEAKHINSTYINIEWKALKNSEIFGIKHGWTICWVPVYTTEHIYLNFGVDPLQKYTRGIQTDEKCVHLPTETLKYTIMDLIGYTEYNITVAFNTKFLGVATQPLVVTTKEDYALHSVYQFECITVSPVKIELYWVLAPLAYTRAERKFYDITYKFKKEGEPDSDKQTDIQGGSTTLVVGNLEPWTDYEFSIKLRTAGRIPDNYNQTVMNESLSKMSCRTQPSVPVEAPEIVNATSFESPITSTLTWSHIGEYQWKGIHEGYTLKYKKKTEGDNTVFDTPVIKNLKLNEVYTEKQGVHYFSKIVLNLSVFTKYELQVAARTQVGVGVWSVPIQFKTCNTESNRIPVFYSHWEPYIGPPVPGSTKPSGVIIEIFEKSIITCAMQCKAFANISIEYEYLAEQPSSRSDSSLFIPHAISGKVDPNFETFVMMFSPGFTLIERKQTTEEVIEQNELLFINGIKQLMPLIVFYFLVNGLFGCIFFFVETYNVTYQKRGKSMAGMFEGLYLAIATSTTVGYGDKIPLSAFGRCYMVLWTLIGLVLTGIVVGALSSALTVAASNAHKYPNEKTAAVHDSLAFAYMQKHFPKRDENEWSNVTSILKEVSRPESDLRYALFETNEIEFVYKPLVGNLSTLVVHGTYNTLSPIGAMAFNEAKKLVKCAEDVATVNYNLIDLAFENLRKAQPQAHIKEELESQPLVQWSAPIYQKILVSMCISLVVLILFGIFYELIRRRILCRAARAKIRPESREKRDKELQDMKDLLEDFESDFEKMKTKMAREGQEMIYKHGEEVLDLFSELKRFSGVDLKYAKESDLVLPLRTILAMKEEQMKTQKNKSK